MCKRIIDHEGNEFPSIKEMCKHWGISLSMYNSRVNKCGWPLEKALTTKPMNIYKTHKDNMVHMKQIVEAKENSSEHEERNDKSIKEIKRIGGFRVIESIDELIGLEDEHFDFPEWTLDDLETLEFDN